MDESVPLYYQMERHIRKKIETGEFASGEAIPSERVLAQTYGINRMTVRKALQNLVCDGTLCKVQGKGTFVSLPKMPRAMSRLNSFSAMLTEKGITHKDVILFSGKVRCGYRLSNIFGIGKEDYVYRIFRQRMGNGKPISLEDTFIPYNLIGNIESIDFEVNSLYALFAFHGIELDQCRQVLSVSRISDAYAELLDNPPCGTAYVTKFTTWDKTGRIVEYTVAYNDPARFVFVTELPGLPPV